MTALGMGGEVGSCGRTGSWWAYQGSTGRLVFGLPPSSQGGVTTTTPSQDRGLPPGAGAAGGRRDAERLVLRQARGLAGEPLVQPGRTDDGDVGRVGAGVESLAV